jgi:hypothetical protein
VTVASRARPRRAAFLTPGSRANRAFQGHSSRVLPVSDGAATLACTSRLECTRDRSATEPVPRARTEVAVATQYVPCAIDGSLARILGQKTREPYSSQMPRSVESTRPICISRGNWLTRSTLHPLRATRYNQRPQEYPEWQNRVICSNGRRASRPAHPTPSSRAPPVTPPRSSRRPPVCSPPRQRHPACSPAVNVRSNIIFIRRSHGWKGGD